MPDGYSSGRARREARQRFQARAKWGEELRAKKAKAKAKQAKKAKDSAALAEKNKRQAEWLVRKLHWLFK